MKHIRSFSSCKTDDDMLQYFVRKTPKAKLIKTSQLEERWLPLLGTVCIDADSSPDGHLTRASAIQAAKEYHNMVSEKLNLKPMYTTKN